MTLLLELYQEELGSTFTSDGSDYDLNALLMLTDDLPVIELPLDELTWVLEYDEPQPERVAAADLQFPILVSVYGTELVAVDGLHRITKALQLGCKTIKARIVTSDMMDAARLY